MCMAAWRGEKEAAGLRLVDRFFAWSATCRRLRGWIGRVRVGLTSRPGHDTINTDG